MSYAKLLQHFTYQLGKEYLHIILEAKLAFLENGANKFPQFYLPHKDKRASDKDPVPIEIYT